MNNTISMDFDLFERVLIYNSLIDQNYLETIVEHIKPSYFKNKEIRTVVECLLKFYHNFGKIPNNTELKTHMTVDEERQALKSVALGFNQIDKTYDKEVLLKNTERFIREKAVLNTVVKTSVDVNSGTFNTAQILADFEKACNISLVESLGLDYFNSIDKHCDDLLKVSKTLSTGWKWLDDKIGGGFLAEGKALYVFYGVTNVGKSIFLGNVASNILNQDKTVLLISLEMSEQVYATRMSSNLSQIAMADLSTNINPLKKELGIYKTNHKNSKLIIKEFPPQSITPNQIKVYIERLVRKGISPDVIVIDYLNLIAAPERGKNSYESIKAVTEQIRALSYHFNCPVVSATQTNRSAYGEANPGLETMSESMGLAHTADAQFSIWSEEGDIELGQIHLGVNKNRFGPIGAHTTLEIDYPTLTLRDSSNATVELTNKLNNKISSSITSSSLSDTFDLIEGLDID